MKGIRNLSIGNKVFSVGGKKITIDKISNFSYHPGWYFVRIMLFLSQVQINDLRDNYNIVFKTKNMIQPGWFRFYLNRTQLNFFVSSRYFELYKPNFKFKFNERENHSYLIFATKDWHPISDYKKIGKHLYVLENISKDRNDAKILYIKSHTGPILENIYSSGFVQNGVRIPSVQDNLFGIYRPLNQLGLDGRNQVVGIVDSGVDGKHCFFHDPNYSIPFNQINFNHRKIVLYDAIADKYDVANGHGTHVCGIVAGNALCKNCGMENYNGVAPGALIYMHDLGDLKGNFGDININFYLERAEIAKSYISSNSWGYPDGHNELRELYSKTAYKYPNITFVFACGNKGIYNSIHIPGNSKNVLSVGATDSPNDDTEPTYYELINGGEKVTLTHLFGITLYSRMFLNPSEFFINISIKHENESILENEILVYNSKIDNCSQLNNNIKVIILTSNLKCNISNITVLYSDEHIYFKRGSIFPILKAKDNFGLLSSSSKGPSDLGYIKPEIVVPGSIMSSKAQDPKIDKIGECSNSRLTRKKGTSMAAPVVSGIVAIIRQFFVEKWYPYLEKNKGIYIVPTSSLIKAMIINCATPFLNKMSSGFGIPVLYESLGFKNISFRFIQNVTIQSNQHHIYSINIINGKKPLRVTMSYLDPPLPSFSFIPLFADLDLIVVDPNGNVYHGNNITDEFSTTEKVIIQTPTVGKYYIHVTSSKMALDSFPLYSIVVHGGFPQNDLSLNPMYLPREELPSSHKCKHGYFKEGKCICDASYFGFDCSIRIKEMYSDKITQIQSEQSQVDHFKFTIENESFNFSLKCSMGCIYCFSFDKFPTRISDPGNQCFKQTKNLNIITFNSSFKTDTHINKTGYLSIYTISFYSSRISIKANGIQQSTFKARDFIPRHIIIHTLNFIIIVLTVILLWMLINRCIEENIDDEIPLVENYLLNNADDVK